MSYDRFYLSGLGYSQRSESYAHTGCMGQYVSRILQETDI